MCVRRHGFFKKLCRLLTKRDRQPILVPVPAEPGGGKEEPVKKRIALVLALLLLLTGCGVEELGGAKEPEKAPETSAEAPAPDLMDGRQPVGSSGNAWFLQNAAIEEMESPNLYAFGDALLLSGIAYTGASFDMELKLISLETGACMAQTALPDMDGATVQTGAGKIGLCNAYQGRIVILNDRLETEQTYAFEQSDGSWYLRGDMKTLYRFDYETGLTAVALETGVETPLVENAAQMSTCGNDTSFVVFSYVDLDTLKTCCRWLDLETGTLAPLPVEAGVGWCWKAGGNWLISAAGKWGDYSVFSGAGQKRLTYEDGALFMVEPGLLCAQTSSTDKMALYAPDGTFRSDCVLTGAEIGYLGTGMVWSSRWNGYFTMAFSAESDVPVRLLFWDMQAARSGADLHMEDLQTAPAGGTATSPELYVRAAEISEKYGMDILIADQCQLEYDSYAAEPVNDPWQIAMGLDELEKALAAYPDGFFDQLCYGSITRLQIELVGALTGREGMDNLTSASAFVQEMADYQLMAADITQVNAGSYYHEIAHMIDNRLSWEVLIREDAPFSEEAWLALQPEGFTYAYSYTEMPEDVANYAYTSGYFVQEYSCTYPTEDRATMMESAMTDATYDFDQNPGLVPKLAYYSRCIRASFNTDGWPAVTQWEEMLER